MIERNILRHFLLSCCANNWSVCIFFIHKTQAFPLITIISLNDNKNEWKWQRNLSCDLQKCTKSKKKKKEKDTQNKDIYINNYKEQYIWNIKWLFAMKNIVQSDYSFYCSKANYHYTHALKKKDESTIFAFIFKIDIRKWRLWWV